MPSHSDLEIKSRLALGLGLLSLVVILLLRLLLPVLAISGLGAATYWLWQQQQRRHRQRQRQHARLNAKFYQLLQRQQGRISILDFAMYSRLDGTAAQAYLNTQAQAFSAYFETTLRGDIIYVFNIATVHDGIPHHSNSQAEVAWAHAERVYVERTRAEKAQAAWANAKQIRTLRQLSQRGAHQPPVSAQSTTDGLESDATQLSVERPVELPTVRGRSNDSESESVITIEVPAVRG